MTTKNYLCFVLLCSFLFGCVSVVNTPPAATATEKPLPTSTSTSLPTATFTITPSEVPTLLPTLEPASAKEALKELLWNNPDCLAPCFMGIVPGQSTLDDVKALFAHLGIKLDQTASQNYVASYKFDTGSSVRIRLYSQSGVITSLDMPVTLPQDQSPAARQEWLTYLPETLIQKYGPPSNVTFFADRGPTPSYAMDMYFDAADMIVEYYSYNLDNNLQICPLTDQFTYIRVWLGNDPVSPPPDAVPLEKATSMTFGEFSKLMTGDPKNACFNLKADMVP